MASTIKATNINTPDGTGNITVDRPLSGSGASLTSLPAANLTGTLPSISGANLTSLPAANLTGTLPAISGASLTGITGNIAFPATQSASADANTLDDYEQGNFTLVVSSHTATGSGQSYQSNSNSYTKVGRMITCSGYLSMTGESIGDLSTGDNMKLNGFPFTSLENGHMRYAVNACDPGAMAITANASVNGYLVGGATYAYMNQSDTTAGVTPLTLGEFSLGSFGYTVTYMTST